jgi:hypothetical protein
MAGMSQNQNVNRRPASTARLNAFRPPANDLNITIQNPGTGGNTQSNQSEMHDAAGTFDNDDAYGGAFDYENYNEYDEYDEAEHESAGSVFDPNEVGEDNEDNEEEEWPILQTAGIVGPNVQEKLASTVNSACTKKVIEAKLKVLQDKYPRPENCNFV